MKHAREDYNNRDLNSFIPDDEPVFLLRAKDIIAPSTVRFWASELEKNGGDPTMVKMARDHADKMEAYKPELTKTPDL